MKWYIYSEYQDTFAKIKSLAPNIEFIEGVPDVIFDSINPKTRNLYIFDDIVMNSLFFLYLREVGDLYNFIP